MPHVPAPVIEKLCHKEVFLKNLIFLILLLPSYAFASNLDIDINKGFLGAKWLSSQEEVETVLGKPNGYYRINKNRTLLFYGKSVSLLISRNRLREVNIGGDLSDALSELPTTFNTKYDVSNLTINGKPFLRERFEKVEEALNIELGAPSYSVSAGTDEVLVDLQFSGVGGYGSENEFVLRKISFAYQL